MFSATSIISCFTFFNSLVLIQCAPELRSEDSYGILVTEWAIRNTVNNLFSTLKLKVLQQKLKLKQYSTIHNFFASITLRDHDNLKKITKLTHVDNIDNGTQVFITQLNEVLNEDNKSDEATDSVYVTILIEDFLSRLDNLKERNGVKNNTKFDLNNAILRHFSNNENEFGNTTYLSKEWSGEERNDSDDSILSSNGFWQPSGRRIFEGKSSIIDRFPFMVSVQFFKKFQCGGSIIKSDLVITSASCLQIAWNNRFFRENPAFLSVQVGSTYHELGGENIPILSIEYHPGFNPKNLRHNLALMRLTRQLKFKVKKRNLKKINFDRQPWPLPSNTDGIVVVGWGAKTLGNKVEINWKNELSYSTLDFYPLEECQEIYSKEFVTDRHFCAGFFSKGGGACNHDAGGPGVSTGILVGVISFGAPQCGTPDAPTVFTKLGYYADWIETIMEMKIVSGRQPTTGRPPKYNYTFPAFTKAKRLKITPIVRGKKPSILTPIPKSDLLRANDKEHDFGQFLKTMFNKKNQQKLIEQNQKQEEERQEEEHQEEGKREEEEERPEKEIRQQEEERPDEKQNEQEETEEITEKESDKTQDTKEVDKVKLKQALRTNIETNIKKQYKLSSSETKNKSKLKEKITWTIESQSHSEENWDNKNTAIIRHYTTFGSNKAPFTVMEDSSDASPPKVASSYEEFTPSHKQRNDGNKEASSGEENEFDEAIDSLLNNLNLNYILDSKENLSVNLQQIRMKDLKSNLTAVSKKKEKKPNNVVEDQNLRVNKKDESSLNNGSVIDGDTSEGDTGEGEEDLEDGTNKYEINKQSDSDIKVVEISDENPNADNVKSHSNDNNNNEHREKVVQTVNKNNEMKGYETDDGGETDEEYETLSIPAESLEQENSSSNITDRLLEMLQYEDLYKLLSEDPNS